MKKLIKFLLWLLLAVIILIVAIYLTAGIWLRTVVSTVVPQMTKTSANLDQADISLLRGRISLKGLKIGNPSGFQKPNAFELKEISVKFEPKSLFTSKIIINEIKIDGTKIDAEIAKLGSMNLMILNDNVQEFLGNPTPQKPVVNEEVAAKKEAEQKNSKAVVVKDLKISNSSLDFAIMSKTLNVKLPDIHEQNIGEKKKETLPDLVAGIFSKLTENSLAAISKSSQESVNQLLDNLAGRSKEASGFVETLKGIF